jgi:hypothetical protein
MTQTGGSINGMRTVVGVAMAVSVLLGTAGVALASTDAPAQARTAPRPAVEHVPTSLHNAQLSYTTTSVYPTEPGKVVDVHGAKASRLITLFNALKREPADTIHCDIAGGPQTTVRFRGAKHTWVATEGACTNVLVTRDGKALPTLLPSTQWSNTVSRDLGNK